MVMRFHKVISNIVLGCVISVDILGEVQNNKNQLKHTSTCIKHSDRHTMSAFIALHVLPIYHNQQKKKLSSSDQQNMFFYLKTLKYMLWLNTSSLQEH